MIARNLGLLFVFSTFATFGGVPTVEITKDGTPTLASGVSQAEAAPRHAVRRTTRRTTRRTVARLSALPAGCRLNGLYYYCGGIYYQEVVDGGATYYIVVTP